MFAIYGISGPIFQGTLENLSRMPPVLRRGPVTAARRVGDQLEIGVSPEQPSPKASALGEQAIDEYQAMLPQELERGPLYQASQIKESLHTFLEKGVDEARHSATSSNRW